jgi:endonuclease/exonuclease/phosphatase family metal-dependent hydrolase
MNTQRLLSTLLLVLATSLAACGSSTDVESSDAISARAVDPGNAGGNKLLTVMSRNLYVGGDLFEPFLSSDPLGTAAKVWGEILASDPLGRMAAVADEIGQARPDLVGLQEAYRFVVTPLGSDEPILLDLDFVAGLEAALGARTLPYRLVAQQQHTVLTVPFPAQNIQITMIDRDAILAGEDVAVGSSGGGDFAAEFVTTLAGVIPVHQKRGWVEVSAKHQGVDFTFVNVHLETKDFGPLQSIQALELAARFAATAPLVAVGDINSDPTDPAHPVSPTATVPTPYTILTGALTDAWAALGNGSGPTCCFDADITPPSRDLFERVDVVLFRGAITPAAARRVGLDPLASIGGRWPSDHAGVVATLRLEDPRFFALR